MRDLTLSGTEDGALILVADDGVKYRLVTDEAVRSAVRRTQGITDADRKLSPREIQAHIRSGMSAADVAAITGADLEYIERFEGPVIAEREHIISSALAIEVHTAADVDTDDEPRTFGTVILERLANIGATGERWASWKEPNEGWIVKLAFTADDIDHDARWGFDPRKSTLVPINNEAMTLSQQGDAAEPIVPRLRAVSPGTATEDGRFDSGAFLDSELAISDTLPPPSSSVVGVPRSPDGIDLEPFRETSAQTADLLDALRRRRGEREGAPTEVDDIAHDHPSTGTLRALDVPLDDPAGIADDPHTSGASDPAPEPAPTQLKTRKGRPTMPSWDEIVFGARPDDDPA